MNNSWKLSSNINVKKKTMFIGVSSMFTCVATCKILGLSPLSINASGATVATTDNILESDTNIIIIIMIIIINLTKIVRQS